jgi:hypothetical protein
MTKQTTSPASRSKVRIFYVDADLAPGDLSELTNTLTTAIRPTHALSRTGQLQRLTPGTPDGDGNGAGDTPVYLDERAEVIEEPVDETTTPKARRNYRKPQPVDMDMTAGGKKPFEQYAVEKGPTAHRGKYLVTAAWLHDFANLQAITADHVFTCYKAADWTFDVTDPTVTFRQLKKEGLGTLKRGTFSINHLGLAEVKKMKPAT